MFALMLCKRTSVQASPGVKDSSMEALQSMMAMSPWGCRDLHFVMTHSLGSKTATEQRRCLARHRAVHMQALGRTRTEHLTRHHQHLRGHSSCGVAAAVITATLLAAETDPSCPYTPPSWSAQVRLPRLCMSVHLCLHIDGQVPAPKRSKLC